MNTGNQQQVETAREALRLAAQKGSNKRKIPKNQLIAELRSEIASMKTQGWTWESIAETLRGTIDASPDTIRRSIGMKKKPKIASKPKMEPQESVHPLMPPSTLASSPTKRFGPPQL